MSYIIKDLEDIVEAVSDWAVTTVQEVTRALSPDGRPFGYVEMTEEEQLNEYFQFKGNPEAWATRIGEIAGDITKKLTEAQVSPDEIMSVHPMDIAQKYLISYSCDMEAILEKNSGNLSSVG